jgi:putative transposase
MRNSKYHQGEQIREEIIFLCMQWYVSYHLSYSQLQIVMQQRGFKIDPRTFNYLVTEYSLLARKRLKETRRKRKTGWRIVQIPFQLNGRKKYLYRAVDAQGNTLDFLISNGKNKEKAKKFFQQTISQTQGLKPEIMKNSPKKITSTDYDWFWGLIIIILLSIWGKVIFDQVERWQKNNKPQEQNSSLSLWLIVG